MSKQVMDFYNDDSSRPFEMSFGQNGKTVGKMRFNGGEMKFEGEADSSASVFIDMIVKKQSDQWEEATSRISELEAKCAALAADNEKAMEAMRQADEVVKRAHSKFAALADENMALRSAIENGMTAPETPSTDAFLAEVRAQGVEMVIAHHRERAEALHHVDRNNAIRHSMSVLDASDVAAKLRQEAAQ